MKDSMTRATKRQRNYALRRVVYDTLIAAKALYVVRSSTRDFPAKEVAKVAGLIMARNLDDFFFMQTRKAAGKLKAKPQAYRYDDDIFICDFRLTWTPATNAMLSDADRERINKLFGHIVADPPMPFPDSEAQVIVAPLVTVAVEFIDSCHSSGTASYTGKAGSYIRKLNGVLGKLALPRLRA